jgi:PHD/YefM family antitoxin component YafN of YafNO toxin-antitoxin module
VPTIAGVLSWRATSAAADRIERGAQELVEAALEGEKMDEFSEVVSITVNGEPRAITVTTKRKESESDDDHLARHNARVAKVVALGN